MCIRAYVDVYAYVYVYVYAYVCVCVYACVYAQNHTYTHMHIRVYIFIKPLLVVICGGIVNGGSSRSPWTGSPWLEPFKGVNLIGGLRN